MQCVLEYTYCGFCSVWPWCVRTCGKRFDVEPSEEIFNFRRLKSHVCAYAERSTVESVHPFHQTLYRLVTVFGSGSKCRDKRGCTVNDKRDCVCFIPYFDICMVNKKTMSPKLSARRPDTLLLCKGGSFLMECSQH